MFFGNWFLGYGIFVLDIRDYLFRCFVLNLIIFFFAYVYPFFLTKMAVFIY